MLVATPKAYGCIDLSDPTEADCLMALDADLNILTASHAAPSTSSRMEVSDALATALAVCNTYLVNLRQHLRPH